MRQPSGATDGRVSEMAFAARSAVLGPFTSLGGRPVQDRSSWLVTARCTTGSAVDLAMITPWPPALTTFYFGNAWGSTADYLTVIAAGTGTALVTKLLTDAIALHLRPNRSHQVAGRACQRLPNLAQVAERAAVRDPARGARQPAGHRQAHRGAGQRDPAAGRGRDVGQAHRRITPIGSRCAR
jgi:hypothetical protein